MGNKKSKKNIRIAELEREIQWWKVRFELLVSREPDTKQLIESLLTGIAPLIIGYQSSPEAQAKQILSRAAQSFDEGHDVFFPDVEFDEHMENPSRWPIPGMISQPQTTPPPVTTLNGSYRIENGETVRSDGEVMFQAGMTGPPAESANE
jgi:hypothetical protein